MMRAKCIHGLVMCLIFLSFDATSDAAESRYSPAWQHIKNQYFGDRIIHGNATDILKLEVPQRVEDAAVVPVRIKSVLDGDEQVHYIKTLYLIVDNNPQPYSAVIHLSPRLGVVDLSTRIRMDSFSNVRVIAEMDDNSLYMVEKFVVASGGCSAPSSKDAAVLLASLGQVKIRMRKPITGEPTTAQIIISHPNANGMQMDPDSGEYIPAFYVTDFEVMFNNELLMRAKTGFTLSETPSLRFKFIPKSTGSLNVKITDSKNNVYFSEKTITD